jgi:predicted small metal-binding protein
LSSDLHRTFPAAWQRASNPPKLAQATQWQLSTQTGRYVALTQRAHIVDRRIETKRGVWSLVTVREADMSRKHIDCREFPSESNCTIAISADSEDELVSAAVQHAIQVHGHQDTPEFRAQIRSVIKQGEPAF